MPKPTDDKRSLLPEYAVWKAMKTRCYNPRTRDYKNYGGRGIIVCDQWKNSFFQFFADMGPCPTGLTLERKDVNGPYTPDNCIWASYVAQGRNRRNNKLLTMNGQTRCISEWADILSLCRGTIEKRKLRGYSDEEALLNKRFQRNNRNVT